MKMLYGAIILVLAFAINAQAQSDTLVIKLKNNQIEKIAVSRIQKIGFENLTDVVEINPAIAGLQLNGNYPNPFGEQTSISFDISSPGMVEITIYDNKGIPVRTLQCDNCQTGGNSLLWDCLDRNQNRVQSGTYFYEVRYGSQLQSRKMIVVK